MPRSPGSSSYYDNVAPGPWRGDRYGLSQEDYKFMDVTKLEHTVMVLSRRLEAAHQDLHVSHEENKLLAAENERLRHKLAHHEDRAFHEVKYSLVPRKLHTQSPL